MQSIIRHSHRYVSTTCLSGILRIHGPDQKGIVAASSKLLDHHGFSIVKSEQFTDVNDFYQRTVFQSQTIHNQNEEICSLSDSDVRNEMEMQLMDFKRRFGLSFVDLDWRIKKKRMAIFVSKYDHCLVGFTFLFFFSTQRSLNLCSHISYFMNKVGNILTTQSKRTFQL